MNNELFFNGILHLGLSLILGIFVLYFAFSRVTKYMIKKYEFTYDNVAFALFISAIIFSVGFLLSATTQPILSVIRIIKMNPAENIYFESAKYIGLFLFIGIAVTLIVNGIAIYFFTSLTKQINEFLELKNNNVAIGIIMSVVIITISVMTRDGLISIMEAFIPFPTSNF
ncbi:MAG: DUF350 domain-containing protein [Chitinophagales bacterium]|nr:DUF350 domain-containing protein [Chitinophagales bacterium]